MSVESADRQQVKYKEFMGLLPLTLAIAGLAEAKSGEHFNEGQMEARATTLRLAYEVAHSRV